jgi:hypothetical protein
MTTQDQRRRNVRLGLMLGLVALALFAGFIFQRYVLLGN